MRRRQIHKRTVGMGTLHYRQLGEIVINLMGKERSLLTHQKAQEEAMRKPLSVIVLIGLCLLGGAGGASESHAQEAKGPTEFTLAILAEHNVSFVLPSTIIVDERGEVSGITLTVTNRSKKEQGFAIDKFRVQEILKPGATKTIRLSATDLDAIGTDQSVFPYYNQLDKAHIGGLLYIKR